MLPAPSAQDILKRAPAWGTPKNPAGERLISIVFADPMSSVWRDLHMNRAFLDARSGRKWDLFFAGMSGFAQMDARAKKLWDPSWREEWPRYLNPERFAEIEGAVSRGHAAAMQERVGASPWRYSGGTDLVSFLCYARKPDWASLVSCRIDEYASRPRRLGEITEGLRDWRSEVMDLDLAPGSFRQPPLMPDLISALQWSAAAVGSGVLGNYVYELLKLVLK